MIDTIVCLLDGARGVYIPQGFAECYNHKIWNYSEKDEKVLLEGPYYEYYWETWADVLDAAYCIDEDGKTWTLYQDGDLFAYREDHDFYEEEG